MLLGLRKFLNTGRRRKKKLGQLKMFMKGYCLGCGQLGTEKMKYTNINTESNCNGVISFLMHKITG